MISTHRLATADMHLWQPSTTTCPTLRHQPCSKHHDKLPCSGFEADSKTTPYLGRMAVGYNSAANASCIIWSLLLSQLSLLDSQKVQVSHFGRLSSNMHDAMQSGSCSESNGTLQLHAGSVPYQEDATNSQGLQAAWLITAQLGWPPRCSATLSGPSHSVLRLST